MITPWLALYVFYGGDQDRAIVDSIAPALRRLRTCGNIGRYFFVRYWNGGPHLRIRTECLAPPAEVERELRQEIQRFLGEAAVNLADIPRYTEEVLRIHRLEQILAGNEVGVVEPLETIRPSGTIETRPYRFDERRYGASLAAIEDAHDHSCISSEVACSILESTKQNPAARRVFALHAAAIVPAVLGVNDSVALDYFNKCSAWQSDPSNANTEVRWQDDGFAPYPIQRAALGDVRALIDGRAPRVPEFWLQLLELWRRELRRRREFLIRARTSDLQPDPDYLILDAMHLFLNRLGIGLRVECYLYYLIAGALRDRTARVHDKFEETIS